MSLVNEGRSGLRSGYQGACHKPGRSLTVDGSGGVRGRLPVRGARPGLHGVIVGTFPLQL